MKLNALRTDLKQFDGWKITTDGQWDGDEETGEYRTVYIASKTFREGSLCSIRNMDANKVAYMAEALEKACDWDNYR